ncbi:MAG TPA: hypothetical protein GX701_03075 [Clostridiales bacterium]|nr:hypothetical protein [Clostridiales bacterium]
MPLPPLQISGLTGMSPAATKGTLPTQALDNGDLFSLLLQCLEHGEGQAEEKAEGNPHPPSPEDPWDERQAILGVCPAIPTVTPELLQDSKETDALSAVSSEGKGNSHPALASDNAKGLPPDVALPHRTDGNQTFHVANRRLSAHTPDVAELDARVPGEALYRQEMLSEAGMPEMLLESVPENRQLETVREFALRAEPDISETEAAHGKPEPNFSSQAAKAGQRDPIISATRTEGPPAPEGRGQRLTAVSFATRAEEREVPNAGATALAGAASGLGQISNLSQAETEMQVEPPARQLVSEIDNHIRLRNDQFTLRLQPEGLGEVTVRLSLRDSMLQVHMRSETAIAGEMIASQLDLLQTGLESAGYQVGQLVLENFTQSDFSAATEHFSQHRQPPGFAEIQLPGRKASSEQPTNRPPRLVYRSGTIHYKV